MSKPSGGIRSYLAVRLGLANARDVRNFFEFALTNQADRLAKLPEPLSDEELLTLLPEDVQSISVA